MDDDVWPEETKDGRVALHIPGGTLIFDTFRAAQLANRINLVVAGMDMPRTIKAEFRAKK